MSQTLTPELPRQNVTVVGAFNPAIIQPNWVRRFVPVLDGELSTFLDAAGGLPLHQAGSLYWQVTPEKLVVYGPISQAGAAAAQILVRLPHTPLRASGVNFLFQETAERPRCGPWRLETEPEEVGRLLAGSVGEFSFSQVVEREDEVRLTLRLRWISEEPDALLDLNYHREGRAPLGEERSKELAAHAERAAEFEIDAQRIRGEILRG